MNCPKHPAEKMTLLLTSYVCDICHPPKGQTTFHGKSAKLMIDGHEIKGFDGFKNLYPTQWNYPIAGSRTPVYSDQKWGDIFASMLDADGYVLCEQPGCVARAEMAKGIPSYLLTPQMPADIFDITCTYGHQSLVVLKAGDLLVDPYNSLHAYSYNPTTQSFSICVAP